jgi:hypothetical protein
MNIELRYIQNLNHSTHSDQTYNGIILDVIMNKFDAKKFLSELIYQFIKFLPIEPLCDDSTLLQINIYNLKENDNVIKNTFRLVNELLKYYGFGITVYFGMNRESKRIIIRTLKNSYDNLLINTPFQNALAAKASNLSLTSHQMKSLESLKYLENSIVHNVEMIYNKYKTIL